MSNSKVKYETAFDALLNKWVTPEDVDIADRYDKPRYYSESDYTNNNGDILTFSKETTEIPYRRPDLHPGKTGFTRQQHFMKLCDNTRENRNTLDKQSKHQESIVHRFAKKVAKSIEYIKINGINTEIFGEEVVLKDEQYISVKYLRSEKADSSGKIPDIVFETEYLGFKSELYLEIAYRHRVGQDKKDEYRQRKVDCIEVDLSSLRKDIDTSDEAVEKFIKDSIIHVNYWISSAFKESVQCIYNRNFRDINNSNILQHSFYEGFSSNKATEAMFFKDDAYKIDLKCYYSNALDPYYHYKCINIGYCSHCNNCVDIKGYESNDVAQKHIYCYQFKKLNKRFSATEFYNIISKIKKKGLTDLRS